VHYIGYRVPFCTQPLPWFCFRPPGHSRPCSMLSITITRTDSHTPPFKASTSIETSLFPLLFSSPDFGCDERAFSPRLKSGWSGVSVECVGICRLYPLLFSCHLVTQKKHWSLRPFQTPAEVMFTRNSFTASKGGEKKKNRGNFFCVCFPLCSLSPWSLTVTVL
jgi:hypothetical protein